MEAPDDGAAFFDLDKTVISRSSMVAFGRPLLDAGMISRRLVAQAAWRNLVFGRLGASPARIERYRQSAMSIIVGWEAARVRAIVEDSLVEAIGPVVFAEALDEVAAHRAVRRRTVLASAGPTEIVAPVAAMLGFDDHVASVAEVDDDGRYTGHSDRWLHGGEKAVAVQEMAERAGIDLGVSWAYSDAASDLPLLEAVGHPVAVNPERSLARIAIDRGWQIARWSRREGLPANVD